MPFFVPGDLDIWPSNVSMQGTKHVFHVNSAQIRSAVPEIFHTHIKKTTDWRRQKRNLSLFTVCGKNIKKVTMQTISSISTMDSYLPPHPLSVTTLPRIMFFNNHIKLQTAKYHIKPSTNSYMHIQLNGHFPIKPMLVRYIPGFLTPLDLELYVISEKKQNFSYTP